VPAAHLLYLCSHLTFLTFDSFDLPFTYVDCVISWIGDVRDGSFGFGWQKHLVLDQSVLMDDTIDVASGQMAAQLCKTPLYKLVPPVESILTLMLIGAKSHLTDRESAGTFTPLGM
jgi:hypothetical protein